jgi:predicted metal-dependent phosphoesterase TrpH
MIDLHTHSTASDGSYSPADLIRYAKTKGIRALALTDHDCVDGLQEAMAVGKEIGVEVIPGVELSAEFPNGTMHILGLFVNPSDSVFLQRLATLQKARSQRNPKIIEKLRDMGIKITYEEVTASSGGGQVGRPHFARVLMKKGYVRTISEAFEKYLKNGGPAYVEKERFSPEECITLIHKAGGVAVLAHPFTLYLSVEELDRLLEQLTPTGLDGVEAYYSVHTPEQTAQYEQLVRKWGLVATGGSDFHGEYKPKIDLGVGTGSLQVPYSVLEELKRKVKIIRELSHHA